MTWQAATAGERQEDRTTGDGVASGHGRRRTPKDDRNDKDDGDEDMDMVTTHSERLCEGRKQSSQDGDKLELRETNQIYALAAVHTKFHGRTQQSLRACPNDRAHT